jgi:hypothetical protein
MTDVLEGIPICDRCRLPIDEQEGGAHEECKGFAADGSRLLLFYVYGDADDTPLVLRNPPAGLDRLLSEWNALDRRMADGALREGEEWSAVSDWLAARGVEVIAPASVRLDSFPPAD